MNSTIINNFCTGENTNYICQFKQSNQKLMKEGNKLLGMMLKTTVVNEKIAPMLKGIILWLWF